MSYKNMPKQYYFIRNSVLLGQGGHGTCFGVGQGLESVEVVVGNVGHGVQVILRSGEVSKSK